MYAVRLRQDVAGGSGSDFHVTMEKAVRLPFAPVPGVGLGLEPDSDFDTDEDVFERVMWHCGRKEFFVELRGHSEYSNPQDVICWLHEHGWTVRLDMGTEDVGEAHNWCRDSDLPAAVRVGGLWVAASAGELWALQHCGQADEVSPVPDPINPTGGTR